ncbi:MAG: hypothetical protein PUC47_02095 [Oscillospiraceae bacterium]|nr:hypothetical protein [Oscillospiraceae bacterium]
MIKGKLSTKAGALFLSLLLVAAVAMGSTVAYLVTQSDSVTNTFAPSHVSCKVTEQFKGTTKSNVNVTNTSDTEAYIRVKLVTYRVNAQEQHIGGLATIPEFKPGTGWVEKNGYYYYTKPVAPGAEPAADLIDSITLTGSYNDADGGKQVIEVMAEAIQAKGVAGDGNKAVVKAWGVDPETLN